jgi:hypothetical protein
VSSAAVQESILTHVARHTAVMLVGNKSDRADRGKKKAAESAST